MSQPGSPARSKSPSRSPVRKGAKGKAPKVKKVSSHPQYKEMIRDALTNLKEKNGSSLQKIFGYILANYNMTGASEAQVNSRLKFALRAGVKHGQLARNVEGVGVTGKFRIPKGGLTAKRRRRRSAKGKGRKRSSRKRKSRKRRSPKRKSKKRAKRTKRRRSPAKRRRRKRVVRRRRARKARVTRRRRKVRSPRRRRRRSVVRRRRARR